MLIDPACIPSLGAKGKRNLHPPMPCADERDSYLPAHFVTHGMMDLQINGFAGVDYNDPDTTPQAIETSLRAMLQTGVTRCLPTVITADLDWQTRCFKALETARTQSALASTMIAGYHLEGPFLNPEPGYCGCHPAADMRAGDIDYFERVQAAANGQIRLVTVAPERPGVLALIEQLATRGICVAIGHSAVDHEMLQRSVDAGATLSTHLGNGVASTLPKSDNVILSQLANDALSASFIADGVHVKPHVLKIYLRSKTSDKTVLVTDGTAGSAAAPGQYTLGKVAIERQQTATVFIPGTTSLAGSATTLDECLRNVVRWFGVPMDKAVCWASEQARTLVGLSRQPLPEESVEWVWWKTVNGEPCVERVQSGEYSVSTDSAY